MAENLGCRWEGAAEEPALSQPGRSQAGQLGSSSWISLGLQVSHGEGKVRPSVKKPVGPPQDGGENY